MTTVEICSKCNKQIMPDEARNGMTGNHWDCDPAPNPRKIFEDMNEAMRNVQTAGERTEALLRKLKRKL